MCRIVTEHKALTKDRDMLQVITVYEEGINRETVKKIDCYTKTRSVLVERNGRYEEK